MSTMTRRKAARTKVRTRIEAEQPASVLTVRMIPLTQIERDDRNHRLPGATAPQRVTDLADSMKTSGQQQPVQVFEYPTGRIPESGHRYLLVFGFRRCAAAEANGWVEIAAVVKSMPLLPDGSVDRMAVERVRGIENLQRENLGPIEEMMLVQQLAENLPAQLDGNGTASRDEDGKLTDDAVKHLSWSIGRTEAWVRDRLYLDRLSPAVKQKVIDGALFLLYAREIAKLADHQEQERVASMCTADAGDGHCHATIHQVRRYVAERQNSLRGVPWHLDKPFPRNKSVVGPCSTCPFNSSNDRMLFEHDEGPAPDGYCLRPACFEAKRALTDKAVAAAVAKIVGGKLAPTESTAAGVAAEFVKPGRVARQAKRQAEGARPKEARSKPSIFDTPEYKARQAFSEAERAWRDEANRKLTEAIRRCPGRLTALALLAQSGRVRWGMTGKDVTRAREFAKASVKPTTTALQKLEKKVLGRRDFDFDAVISVQGREEFVVDLASMYDIELPPLPTLEAFMPGGDGQEDKSVAVEGSEPPDD